MKQTIILPVLARANHHAHISDDDPISMLQVSKKVAMMPDHGEGGALVDSGSREHSTSFESVGRTVSEEAFPLSEYINFLNSPENTQCIGEGGCGEGRPWTVRYHSILMISMFDNDMF